MLLPGTIVPVLYLVQLDGTRVLRVLEYNAPGTGSTGLPEMSKSQVYHVQQRRLTPPADSIVDLHR
jgi:hypothetical protein